MALTKPGTPAPRPEEMILDIDASLLAEHFGTESAAGACNGRLRVHLPIQP